VNSSVVNSSVVNRGVGRMLSFDDGDDSEREAEVTMNKHAHVFSATPYIMLATLSFVAPAGTAYSQDRPQLSAGAASVNITPQEKIPIGRHSGENTPYDSIHPHTLQRVIWIHTD
jgi:hypothetical protein